MKKPIILIGGSKGGVGKSMVCIATIDLLIQRGEKIFLVETDESNPDVYKCYRDEVDHHLLNLDDDDGWIQLVNLCDATDTTVVINTAARNNIGIRKNSELLCSSLSELQRELITLWVINNQKDSVALLAEYLESIKTGKIHVIKNQFFGDEKDFEFYNSCNTKKIIESSGGKSLNFPQLATRVSNEIYTNRLSLTKAALEMPLGNRAELSRWRNTVKCTLSEAIDA